MQTTTRAHKPDDRRQRWQDRMSIEMALTTCQDILDSGFAKVGAAPDVIFEATFAYLLACLSDALQRLSKRDLRVDFRDDIDQANGDRDITDLVAFCRNAACHFNSRSRRVANHYFTPAVLVGKRPAYITMGTRVIGSHYDDETAVVYGTTLIYLNRHVVRAVTEARERAKAI